MLYKGWQLLDLIDKPPRGKYSSIFVLSISMKEFFYALTLVAKVIKLFSSVLTGGQSKLECLSLASLSKKFSKASRVKTL